MANSHQNDNYLKLIQNEVSLNIIDNQWAENVVVRNDEEITEVFGYNVLTQEDIEVAFLQYVHEVSTHKKNIVTLEIAAGAGFVSWKVPLAFENSGVHYANELSKTMLAKEFTDNIAWKEKVLGKSISPFIKQIPGDCFNILQEHPELKHSIDVIYVANLEQYFNPIQHQQFIQLIDDLLASGGRAFLCANSYESTKIYPQKTPILKDPDIYPYFLQTNIKVVRMNNSEEISVEKIAEIRPEDNTLTRHVLLNNPDTGYKYEDGYKIYINGIYSYSNNAFSPDVYRNALSSHKNLKIIDSFFLTDNGKKVNRAEFANRVGTIIEKK